MTRTTLPRLRRDPRAVSATDAVALGLLCLLWGSTWLVIRAGLTDLPPCTGAALRFALAGLVMTLLVPLLARREGGAAPPRRLVLIMGLGNFTLPYAAVYWAEVWLPSGLVSVLWALYPLWVLFWAARRLQGEGLKGRHRLGFCVGFAGVALLCGVDGSRWAGKAWQGALLGILSPAVAAWATVTIKAEGTHVSSLRLNRAGMLVGALGLAALALLLEDPSTLRLTARAVGSLLYLSLGGTVLTFGLYFWLLRRLSASRLSLVSYVIPVLALALGHTLGGEPLGPGLLLGTTLVLLGLALGAAP